MRRSLLLPAAREGVKRINGQRDLVIIRENNEGFQPDRSMFRGILSDEAAGLAGGLGMAPGLCVGSKYCMAQAAHGSAPDIAGKPFPIPMR